MFLSLRVPPSPTLPATLCPNTSVSLAAPVAVVRAEAALSAVEATLPGVEQRIGTARHALAVLFGQTPQSFAGPATATTSLPHIAQIDVCAPADLLRRRPDIAAAERALAAATARRGVEIGRAHV